MLKVSLAAALKNTSQQDVGMDPRQIPSWVQVSLPVAKVRDHLLTGKVVLPMSEIIAGLEPEYRNLFEVRSDLQVELPMDEMLHALPKIAAEPKPSAFFELPGSADSAPAIFDEQEYDPFASVPTFPEWKGAPLPAAEVPELPAPASSADFSMAGAGLPKAPEHHFPPVDFPPPLVPSGNAWSFGNANLEDHKGGSLPPVDQPASMTFPEDDRVEPMSLMDDEAPVPLFDDSSEEDRSSIPASSDAGLSAFLSQMPATSAPAPAHDFGFSDSGLVVPSPAAPAPVTSVVCQPPGSHRQLLLRVLFGVQEDLTKESVIEFTARQPGVASAVCISDGQLLAASGDGSPEAEQFSRHAAQIHQHLMPLIELTGITDAETFSINSEHNILTFSKQDGMTLAVLHSREEGALKEKITLIARELAGLLRDEA